MNFIKFYLTLFIVFWLTSCGSNNWFGKEKRLDMPGERVPLNNFNLHKSPSVKVELGTSQSINQWNGWLNQFDGEIENFIGSEPIGIPSKTLNISGRNSLIQASFPNIYKDQIIILNPDGNIKCYDINTYQALWSNKDLVTGRVFTKKFFAGGIKRDEDKVFVTAGVNKLLAIDANTGSTIWQANFSAVIRAVPLVVKDLVIVQSLDNKVYAMNKNTGQTIWTYIGTPEDLNFLSLSAPILINNKVIVKFTGNEIAALNLQTGEEVWSTTLLNRSYHNVYTQGYLNGANLLMRSGNDIIATNNLGQLFKIDSRTGVTIWVKDIMSSGKIWICRNVIYTLSAANDLIAIDIKTGSVIWNLPIKDKKVDLYLANPIMVNNYIYLVSNLGKLYMIDVAEGKMEAEYTIEKGIYLPPLFINDKVFLISNKSIVIY